MAERFSRQAQQELNPVIAASQQMITPNISATQQLFRNLVAGLEGQAATSVSDINADATARGVGRAGLAADVTAGLNPALMAGTTGLGAQQAGQLSDLRVAGGQLQADKATLVNQLASSLQESDIDARQFEQDKIAQDRAQQLAIKKAQQEAARRAAEQAAAQAAAQPQAAAEFKNGKDGTGGFKFTDANGNPISAYDYAQITGQDPRDVFRMMGESGDGYAASVYQQLARDPDPNQRLGQYKKLYAPLFNAKFDFNDKSNRSKVGSLAFGGR